MLSTDQWTLASSRARRTLFSLLSLHGIHQIEAHRGKWKSKEENSEGVNSDGMNSEDVNTAD